MKKGDILFCNDNKTTVKLIDFDEKYIWVEYNSHTHQREITIIGEKLHYKDICWNCNNVFSVLSNKCDHCGTYICRRCCSCQSFRCDYHKNGFSNKEYDRKGFNREGFNRDGFNRKGYDREGYDREGYDRGGYDREGYDREGFNHYGYDRNGFDREGFNVRNYNKEGFNRDGAYLFDLKK